MALDGASFSPKEFKLAISADGEGTTGTKQTNALTAINIDSLEMPSFNPTQVFDVRSGSSGRLADVDDILVSQNGVTKEISFSGILTTELSPILFQNCFAKTHSNSIIEIPAAYEPPSLATGNTSQGINHTVTLYLTLPNTTDGESSPGTDNHSIILPGCTITSLQITGDMGSESGRLRFTATARTGYRAEFSAAEASIASAYTVNTYSLSTLAGASGLKTIGGATDCVIQSFSLNIENPSEYVGQHDANGNPEAIVRAVPELAITLDATVKYDNGNAQNTQTTAEYQSIMNSKNIVANALHNHSSSVASATGFGFEGSFAQVTSAAFNEANAMMIDVSQKFFSSGSSVFFKIRY